MKFQLNKAIEILSSTPKTLKAMLGDLSEDWTLKPNTSNCWSAFDILGHFIHGEETDWIPRTQIILAQDANNKFESFDRFAQFEASKGKTLNQMLDEFQILREKNIKTLINMNLTEKHLQLKGIHPELGEVTLEQMLSAWVVHDLTHIRQIATEMAQKYKNNVGAWTEFMSILK